MSWRAITLGDAIHVKHGFAFKSEHFSDSGEYLVLTPGNFNEEGGFRLRPGKDRFYAGDIPEEYVLDEGDLIVAMTEQAPGLLGSSALLPNGNRFLHNQRLGLIQGLDETVLDKKFLYYLFNTRSVRGQISGSATGTKVRHTAPERIYRVNVSVPSDVTVQKRIALILSAYDDLIENNRRRIQLLEHAARLLYKEWCVHLRFPGHEHVTITDGVPQGWERRSLKECVSVIETGSRPKGGVSGIEDGIPSIGAESIIGAGQFDFSKTKYVPETYFWKLKKGVVQNRDVLVYKDGGRPGHFTPHISFFGGGFPFGQMALNSHVYRIRGTNDVSQEFLYYHLSSNPMMSWMNKAGSGAAIPGIARKDLLRLPVIVPSSRVLEMFTEVAAAALTQILTLALATMKLRNARDLLLPRLMNGEVAA